MAKLVHEDNADDAASLADMEPVDNAAQTRLSAHQAVWDAKLALLEVYRAEFGDVDVPSKTRYREVNLGQWVRTQRRRRSEGKMSDERIAALDALGMVWAHYQRDWDDYCQLLCAYVAKHGTARVPQRFVVDGIPLGTWLIAQRKPYREGKLSTDRVSQLELLGVEWTIRTPWDDALEILSSYAADHGDANAPDGFVHNDFPLGTWLQTQRREFRLGKISQERINRLDALGMVWDFNDTNWERNFAVAADYAKKHSSLNMPQTHEVGAVRLGRWLINQRNTRKEGTLSAERIARLDALGMVWDLSGANWERNFDLLLAYVEEHGNARVPISFVTSDGSKLGRWASKQRTHQRRGTLSPERQARLVELGVLL